MLPNVKRSVREANLPARVVPSSPGETASPPGRWTKLRRQVTSSNEWALLVRWYFSLLLLSMVAKYFSTQWGDVLNVPTTHPGLIGRLEHFLRWARRVFLVYRLDVIEAWLVVLLAFVLGHVVARVRVAILAWVSLTFAVVIAFACWLALSQTGVPLTRGTVMIGIQWGWEHPDVIPTIVPLRELAVVLAVAVAFGSLPLVTISKRQGALGILSRRLTELLTVLAPVVLLLVLLTPGRLLPTFTSTSSPTEGYWSSSIVALADVDRESPVNLVAPSRAALMESYRQVAYPLGRPATSELIATIPPAHAPKHVVLIALETAPNAYYPLGRDPGLPTFAMMARNSIVSEHHFTTRTYTLLAIYGMLTGTYPRPGTPIGEFGPFHNDGLAATLRARGYESSYIDSYKVDWGYHYRSELERQGFTTILDTAGFRPPAAEPFDVAVAREQWSFHQALSRISAARQHRTRALVVVATTLGHFPWRAPAAFASAPSADKLLRVAQTLDATLAQFLRGLDSLGQRDSTIIIVTGDHGLRYKAEFDSFGAGPALPNVDFNVPFLLYAPGQIRTRIELPYPTSHVDIAPTVYALLGIPVDSLVLHGENMLDARIARRATFLMNTGLNPNDGFLLDGHRFESNTITHEVRTTPPFLPGERAGRQWTDASVPALLAAANHVFNLTAAYFLSSPASAVQR
ncbi:MAG TPA: sulfatase-like hydrolase/transferase [Gemmatimonadaceae bacterium]|nr:sulfatase-like hydrolase/transferase [Gemmatimonadaceae bacterium]